MAISDLSTVSAGRPRAFVCNRGADAKVFSITTRIAATVLLALGAIAAIPADDAQAQDPTSVTVTLPDDSGPAATGDILAADGTVDITVRLNEQVPTGQMVTLPFTIDSTSTATITTGYVLSSPKCANTAACTAGEDIVFNAGEQETTLTVTARNGGDGETIIIVLTDGDQDGVIVDDTEARATITLRADIDHSFEIVNVKNQRMVINGDPGEFTLRIRNFEFPTHTGTETSDVLAVGFRLSSGTDHNGALVSHGFAVGSVSGHRSAPTLTPPRIPITTNGAQEITGADLSIRLTNPNNLRDYPASPTLTNLSQSYQPYIINQSSGNFRVILPRALFAAGAGRNGTENAEDVTFQIVPGGREGARPESFNLRVGGSTNGAVWGTITNGLRDDGELPSSGSSTTLRIPPDEFPAGDSTPFHFTVVRASDAAQLPRLLNPAAQDIMRGDTTLVTVALPPIMAHADAAKAVIAMAVSANATDAGGTTTAIAQGQGFLTEGRVLAEGIIDVSLGASGRFFRLQAPADVGPRGGTQRTRDEDIALFACDSPNPGHPNPRTCLEPADAIVNLSVVVSGGQRLSGDVVFSVAATGTALQNRDDVVIEATSISFLNSEDRPVGETTTLTSDNVAKVTALTTGPTTVLNGLTVDGNIVYLSTEGTLSGRGNVSIGSPVTEDNPTGAVPVTIDLGDDGDSSLVTGTNAEETDLTGIDTTARSGDRPGTHPTPMLTGFTAGINTLTVRVRPNGATDDSTDRVYTISVFVPPSPTDSTLASATVNSMVVLPDGTVAIPATTTATIVATPTSSLATALVCDASGDFVESDATGFPAAVLPGPNTFTIYVVAAKAADGTTDVPIPGDCTTAAPAAVAAGNATATPITVTVATASADLSALTVMPSGGGDSLVGFNANTLSYGVTLDDLTTSATIVATPSDNNAAIAVTVDAIDGGSVTYSCDPTTGGASNTCTVNDIDAGETAVVTMRVTVSDLSREYTIAIGPASARLVLIPTEVAPGEANAVELTLQVRNYGLVPTEGFLSANIATNVVIPALASVVTEIDGAEFDFNVSAPTGINAENSVGSRGGFGAATGGFRVIVPKGLMDAGNNGDAASLVNGANIVIDVEADEDVRIFDRMFTLGTVGALMADQSAATSVDAISDVDTDAVTLGIDATTTATLSLLGDALGTDGAILVASGGMATAQVSIKNPAGGGTLTGVAFRVRTGTDDDSTTAFLTRTSVSDTEIDFGDLTVDNTLTGTHTAINTGTDGLSGWTLDVATVASPIVMTLPITLDAGLNDGDFYTLELAQLTTDNIGEYDNPTRVSGTDPANNGRIEVGAIVQALVMTPGETITHAEEPASIGTTAIPDMLGRIPLTLTLDSIPNGLTEIVYEIATGGAHAKARDVDYGIGCQRVTDIPNPINCRTGKGYDLDGGGIDDIEQITTGTVVFPAGAFDQNVATFEIQITPFADSVVEGTETVEITLMPPAGVAAPSAFTVNITDSTTSSVTVTPAALTVAEGTTLRVTVSLDDQGLIDTDEDGNEISIAKIVAEETEFTLRRLAPETGTTPADDDDIRLTPVTILAGAGSGSIDMLIVPDGTVMDESAVTPESFRLGIVSIAASTRTDLAEQLPADTSGPPQWVATSDITINEDAVDNTTNATLETDGLTVGGADPIGFEPGPIPPATGDPAAGGTISLPADTLSVEVIADPDAPVSAITEISGRQGNDCTAGPLLGVNVPEVPAPQIDDAGATITATVGGETGEAGVLVTGENCIRVIVTAGDTTTTNTYDVIVTVVRSDEARLAATAPLTLDPTGPASLVNVGDITYLPNEDDPTSASATIILPAGTTAGALAINARDPNALIDNLGGSVTGTLAGIDIAATADLTVIANEGTITFDVTAEDRDNTGPGTVVRYTITIVVQDAELASASFAGRSSSNLSDNGTTLTGSGDITGIRAGTTSGELFLVPADTDDTIIRVTGTNESGANLMGIDADDFVHGTANTRTVTLGNIGIGTSEVKVVVRPAGAEDDTADRTYTISLIVTPNPAARVAGIMVDGATTVRPAVLPATRTDPVKLNFFARDFSTASNTTSGLGTTNNAVQGISFTLRFAGIGPSDTATNFAHVGDTGVLNNNYFRVEFPTHGEDSLAYSPQTSGGSLPVEEAGDIRVIARSSDFISDGAIYIPVEIEMLAAIGSGMDAEAITGGTVSIIGAVQILRSRPGTRVFFDSSVSGDNRDYTPVSPNIEVAYSVVAGPSVTLTSEATATEAGPADGTLDMVLTRNLAELIGVADVTYTIGGDATRGANADYMLTVEGAPPANCNASGVGCTYRFPASSAATQTARVVVMPRDDPDSEDDEMVTIEITDLSFPGASPTAVIPSEASEVTIIDNDADANLEMFSDLTISETGSAMFQVALSSAPDPGLVTTINLTMTGTADYTDDYIIRIDNATTGTNVGTAATSGPGGTAATTTTPASGEDTVTFYVVAVANSRTDGDKTIIVNLSSVTDNQTPTGASTDYDENQPARTARTITIQDDDVAVRGYCSRSERVRAAILAHSALDATRAQKACPAVGSDDAVLGSELARIIGPLSVDGITAALPLKAGDFEGLNMVTGLTLAGVQGAELPDGVFDGLVALTTLTMTGLTYTRLANGVLDDVLGDLTALNITPSTIAFPTSPAASNVPVGSTGQTITLQLLEDSEVIPTRVRVPVTISGAARDLITLSGSGVDTNAADNTADSNTATYGFTLGAGQTSITFTATVTGAETGDIGDSATLTLGTTMLSFPDFATRPAVANSLAATSATPDHDLTLTLPPVSISLAPSEISIGEKSLGSETITLTLNGVLAAHGSTARVMFDILDPDGDETAVPGVPTLDTTAFTSESNPGDYTLVVNQDLIPNGTALSAAGNTFEITSGTSATFTFTAIDDDRREGSERTTITVTGVNFPAAPSANITGAPTSATVEITEISGDDVMRETEMITHIVGKEQVNLVTGLVRQRVNALTLGTPQGFSTPGVQVSLAENPETMQDFFSQMALESSGEMDDGGAYAIWGRGQYISISGTPDIAGTDNFEYDGTIGGVGMGIERRFSETLFGLSMNFSSADIDSKSSTRAESNYKETMTFFAPYAAWKPDNSRLTLWGAAGAGFGSAEITGEGHAEGNPSVQAFFAQGGVDISDNIGKTAEVVFGLSAVAIEKTVDGFTAGTLSVPETESSVFQGQADFTAYFPVYSDDGQVLRPYVGLASVHDAGDVLNDDRHAMELQTGIAWSNGPWQVSLDTFYQFLRDDEEAWGIFGEAHWTGRGDLDGLLMGMTSGHGTASSMSDAVSSTDSVNSDIDTNLTNADSETAEWSIQTTTEYGFAAPLLDRNGRATPFFRSTHSADARSFESGVRMDVTDNIGMTVETNRHIPADDDPYSEHAVGLEARWEF